MSLILNNNKLTVDEPLSVRLLDSSGNSMVSNSGALRVSLTGGTINGSTFNIKDSLSNNILTTNGGIRTADYTNDLLNGAYIGQFGNFNNSISSTLQKMNMYRDVVSVSGSDITTIASDSVPMFFSPCLLSVSSTSLDDRTIGNGARTLVVSGTDASNNFVSTEFSLNGILPATPYSGDSYVNINSVSVLTCGSNQSNIGKITVYNATTGVELANILPNLSSSLNSNMTIASLQGSTVSAILRRLTIQSLGPINVYIMYLAAGSSVWKVIDMCLVNGSLSKDICFKALAGDSIKLNAISFSGSTPVSAQLEYIQTIS